MFYKQSHILLTLKPFVHHLFYYYHAKLIILDFSINTKQVYKWKDVKQVYLSWPWSYYTLRNFQYSSIWMWAKACLLLCAFSFFLFNSKNDDHWLIQMLQMVWEHLSLASVPVPSTDALYHCKLIISDKPYWTRWKRVSFFITLKW